MYGLKLGREIGLNSEYSTGKWEFIAKEQSVCEGVWGGVGGWKISKRVRLSFVN